MTAGVIICSRMGSARVPGKPMTLVNGFPLLQHLVERLRPTGLPIVLAIPPDEYPDYVQTFEGVRIFVGHPQDPLRRMAAAAAAYKFDVVVRVTHDKVFVESSAVTRALDIFNGSVLDYIFSSSFVPGSGFEIIRTKTLSEAALRFENVEHISYAVQAVTGRKTDIEMGRRSCRHRLLVDYPEDVEVIDRVLSALGSGCSLDEALRWLDDHPEVSAINRMPLVSVYTCAYNAGAWIQDAMKSVVTQKGFRDFEYLLVDDASTDSTADHMRQCLHAHRGVQYFRNGENRGLATSSNFALSRARGKYIIRLDADDYFSEEDVVLDMATVMEAGRAVDALYPDHYLDSDHVEKGAVHHHAGGAMFATRALNHMRFTDGLRGHDSYDLFERAKEQLRIGYYERPAFFYRQHATSMSKGDAQERARIKEEIDGRLAGRD